MICSCGALTIQAKDGLCGGCRLRLYARAFAKYTWTPEMDAQLTHAYRAAKGKADLTKRLRELMRQIRFPRHILQNRATTLGLRSRPQTLWADADMEVLREQCGTMPLPDLAKLLGRTPSAVKNKLFTIGLGCAVTEGYSENELAQLFGVHHNKVGLWVARGWLELKDHRITHESVERFIWDHMNDYRFASCEEWWLKTMLQPMLGRKTMRNLREEVAA